MLRSVRLEQPWKAGLAWLRLRRLGSDMRGSKTEGSRALHTDRLARGAAPGTLPGDAYYESTISSVCWVDMPDLSKG